MRHPLFSSRSEALEKLFFMLGSPFFPFFPYFKILPQFHQYFIHIPPIFYLILPYFTIFYHILPQSTIFYHILTKNTLLYQILQYLVPYSIVFYHISLMSTQFTKCNHGLKFLFNHILLYQCFSIFVYFFHFHTYFTHSSKILNPIYLIHTSFISYSIPFTTFKKSDITMETRA